VCGPPASGKSRLCRELHEAVQWPHFATDLVRKQLAGIAPTERAQAEHYSREFSDRTYHELLRHAAAATADGAAFVMLDGNFPTPAHRQNAAQAAAAVGARLAIAYVEIDATTATQRARDRLADASRVSDADAAIAATLHQQFIAPTSAEAQPLISLHGATATTQLAEQVLTALLTSCAG